MLLPINILGAAPAMTDREQFYRGRAEHVAGNLQQHISGSAT